MTRKYKNNICEENGKFYGMIKIKGEQRQFLCHGATTRAEAQAIVDAEKFKLRQEQAGLLKIDKKIRIKVLLRLYDNYAKTNKKSYGRDSFLKVIGTYLGNDTLVDIITPQKIEDFKIFLKEKGLSNSTINKYRAALSKMFNLGIANKLIKENPVKDVKAFREENYKIRYLTVCEEERLYKAIDNLFPYLKPIVTTALQTGMRRGEIFNLKWEDIDFDYAFIEILESKSGKSRKIPISNTLMKVLKEQSNENAYVFVNPNTQKPYTDIKHSFQTVLKEAKITNFRFHDLRHTVGTRLAEKGIPLPVVQEILGHSKISTTMRYTHAIPQQKLEAINVLNNYFIN